MSDRKSEEQEVQRGDFARKKGEIVLREHEYDGIQEFDQKLPNWWLFTLYIAIAWTIGHWSLYYYTNSIKTDEQRVTEKLDAIMNKKAQALAATLETLNNETMITDWVAKPEVLAAGEATFSTYCAVCHGADMTATMMAGETKIPLPGLSLVDGEWKYGSKPMDIFKIINDGSPAGSTGHNGALMQPWGQTLSTQQVTEVSAYVISKNPEEFTQ